LQVTARPNCGQYFIATIADDVLA